MGRSELNDMEKEELFKRIHAMDSEELELACMAIPSKYMWDELRRRSEIQDNMISAVRDVVRA